MPFVAATLASVAVESRAIANDDGAMAAAAPPARSLRRVKAEALIEVNIASFHAVRRPGGRNFVADGRRSRRRRNNRRARMSSGMGSATKYAIDAAEPRTSRPQSSATCFCARGSRPLDRILAPTADSQILTGGAVMAKSGASREMTPAPAKCETCLLDEVSAARRRQRGTADGRRRVPVCRRTRGRSQRDDRARARPRHARSRPLKRRYRAYLWISARPRARPAPAARVAPASCVRARRHRMRRSHRSARRRPHR
jgi:hypothetical protein